MKAKYAVLGSPISHSLSPKIHRMFAAQQEVKLSYEKLEPPIDDFDNFVKRLHQKGYHGLNVTLPFKLLAYQLSDAVSERAWLAGAVNTLIRTDQGWRGDNTDGIGLCNDLYDLLGEKLADTRILILGAGGSVQGILPALVAENVASIHIANRTAEKAIGLAEAASKSLDTNIISGSGLEFKPQHAFDILVNATASGLNGEVPKLANIPIIKRCCYDLFYADKQTAFMHWCANKLEAEEALIIADGLGMLVQQAAASYNQWRSPDLGKENISAVLQKLKDPL